LQQSVIFLSLHSKTYRMHEYQACTIKQQSLLRNYVTRGRNGERRNSEVWVYLKLNIS